MRIREIASTDVCVVDPRDSLTHAATLMSENDVDYVAVSEDGRLVGVATDRDIVVRAIAYGLGPETRVERVMTKDVTYCFGDDESDDVSKVMATLGLRHLPVVDRDRMLIGDVSLADFAPSGDTGLPSRSRSHGPP